MGMGTKLAHPWDSGRPGLTRAECVLEHSSYEVV